MMQIQDSMSINLENLQKLEISRSQQELNLNSIDIEPNMTNNNSEPNAMESEEQHEAEQVDKNFVMFDS